LVGGGTSLDFGCFGFSLFVCGGGTAFGSVGASGTGNCRALEAAFVLLALRNLFVF
jgi:hypothetical protein